MNFAHVLLYQKKVIKVHELDDKKNVIKGDYMTCGPADLLVRGYMLGTTSLLQYTSLR